MSQDAKRDRLAGPQDRIGGQPIEPDDLASINGGLAQLKAMQKKLIRESSAIVAIEPHHDYHSYALGRDRVVNGGRADDAFAFMGLHSLAPARFCMLIDEAAKGKSGNDLYIVRLELNIIDRHRDQLEARGRYVSWRRRWTAYHEQVARWEAEPEEERKHGHWRLRAMTSGQRELIGDTARLLGVAVPGDADRGGAHDWLAANGANVVYRKAF